MVLAVNFRDTKLPYSLLSFLGTAVYFYRDELRDHVSGEVSHVASRSLENELLQQKAQDLAKALLQALLSDDKVRQNTSNRINIYVYLLRLSHIGDMRHDTSLN